jgi:hypothetical protein
LAAVESLEVNAHGIHGSGWVVTPDGDLIETLVSRRLLGHQGQIGAGNVVEVGRGLNNYELLVRMKEPRIDQSMTDRGIE